MRTSLASTFLLALIACCGSYAGSPPIRITLEGYKIPHSEAYVLGEGVQLLAILENNTTSEATFAGVPFGAYEDPINPWHFRVAGDAVGDVCYRPSVMSGERVTTKVMPGKRISKDIKPNWRLGPGKYEAWIEYDPPKNADWFFGPVEDDTNVKERLESNHLFFEIVRPRTVDDGVLAVFEAQDEAIFAESGVHSWCNSIAEFYRERLLEEFPTSSYAGWALLGPPSRIKNPAAMTGVFSQNDLPEDPEARNSEQRIRSAQKEVSRRKAEKLKAYLEARPDFDEANRMRFQIAWYLCDVGEFAKAKETLAPVLEEDCIQPWLRNQTKALFAFAEEKSKEKEQR